MILNGCALEVLKTLETQSIQTCVTSPPYWGLRDYGHDGQLGHEQTPDEYVRNLVDVFREVRRVLKDDGTVWLNLGDSYAARKKNRSTEQIIGRSKLQGGFSNALHAAVQPDKLGGGLKLKDLVGMPWRVALALQADGWYLRSDIIWSKPNVIPESIKDRPCRSHEYIFLLSKSPRYYYDHDAIREPYTPGSLARAGRAAHDPGARMQGHQPGKKNEVKLFKYSPNPLGRNKRTVWSVSTRNFKDAHFATFPPELVEPCVLAGSPPGGVVLDPFFGAGTTGLVARRHGREYVGIELNATYCEIARRRIESDEYQTKLRLR